MIEIDAVGDVLQKGGLACFRRRDDEASLAFAERGEEIEDAGGEALGLGLELEDLVRIDGDQLGEGASRVAILLDGHPFDRLEADELEVVAGAAGGAADLQSGLEMKLLDQRAWNDGITRNGVVVVLGLDQDAGAVLLDEQDAFGRDELAWGDVERRRGAAVFLGRTAAFAPSATATAAARAPSASSPSAGTVLGRGRCFIAWRRAVAVALRLPFRTGSAPAASAATPFTRSAIVWCHLNSNSKPNELYHLRVPGTDDSGRRIKSQRPAGMPNA